MKRPVLDYTNLTYDLTHFAGGWAPLGPLLWKASGNRPASLLQGPHFTLWRTGDAHKAPWTEPAPLRHISTPAAELITPRSCRELDNPQRSASRNVLQPRTASCPHLIPDRFC